MKLFNQFNVLPRYLTAFNYAGLNLNETPKELQQCPQEFQNFWSRPGCNNARADTHRPPTSWAEQLYHLATHW